MNYIQDNMFLGQLPERLIIGYVDSNALNGTITKNPFDFKHYKINFVALNVDGPLQLDFENAGYIRSYMRLYTVSVRERCIKTKEIPSPERDTLKETPYLDSMWLQICRKCERFNW